MKPGTFIAGMLCIMSFTITWLLYMLSQESTIHIGIQTVTYVGLLAFLLLWAIINIDFNREQKNKIGNN
jgi:glycine betaine/choline ABC-type transport system substrate-binding protein